MFYKQPSRSSLKLLRKVILVRLSLYLIVLTWKHGKIQTRNKPLKPGRYQFKPEEKGMWGR
jgi:hypothetical protein